MSKRLQVVLDERELKEIRRIAKRRNLTVSEWVRQVLRAAREQESQKDPARKLRAIEAALEHSFPTGDIEQILAEIEAGYASGENG